MKKYMLWISLLAVVGSMLSACSGSTPSSPSLVGDWKLVSYNSTPALPDVDTAITFDADRVGGTVGCNSFGGDYKVDGGQIVFGEIVSTMMACDDPRMQQEAAVFAVFVDTAIFKMDGDTLTITSKDSQYYVVLAKK